MNTPVALKRSRNRATPARRLTRLEGWPVAGVLVLAGCAWLGWQARHLTFYLDDWEFVLHRRGWGPGVFLRPHNEHLSALPILAYKVLLDVFGARSYAPFMALLIAVHALACLLLYAFARRHLGPWAALIAPALLVVLGPAWMDLLWAFQIGFVGSTAAGLGMLLCLERQDGRCDPAAALLLGVSLLCSSVGLGFGVLALVAIALHRPRSWRRLWVALAPLAAYAVWYARYGASHATAATVHRLPHYLPDAAAAAFASLTGLATTWPSPDRISLTFGAVLAALALALLGAHLVRGGRLPPVAWGCLAALVALWTAQCLSDPAANGAGREPTQSRYQYVPVVLLVAAAAASIDRRRLRRGTAAGLALATIAATAVHVSVLDRRASFWTAGNAPYTHALLGVLQVARGVARPDFVPEDLLTAATIRNYSLLLVVAAGPYYAAADRFGSPADSSAQLLRRPERVREAADLVLVHAEGVGPAATAAPLPPGCADRAAGAEYDSGPATVLVRPAQRAAAELELRRFAQRFALRWPLAPGATYSLRLPADRSSQRWHLRVLGGPGVAVCADPAGRTA